MLERATVFDFLAALFGPRIRLPRDRVKRLPRAVRRAAKEHTEGMQRSIDAIGSLEGLADMARTKRAPRGFHGLVEAIEHHFDAYVAEARKRQGLESLVAAGEPGGSGACHDAPFGVFGIEALAIYREIRPWRDFPQVAQRIAELGQRLFEDIQAQHKGNDPEKIRMGGPAVQKGRRAFAQRGEACPFLDKGKERCRLGDKRPMTCKMHFLAGDPALADPRHPEHARVEVVNIRLPVRQQVAISQIDKRMELQLSPFLYASLLQIFQLTEGELLQEVGEVPRLMGQDGRVAPRANRSKGGKAKKKKKKK